MAVNLEIIRELVEEEVSYDPSELPMEWRIEFEERAAILEYEGGLSRDVAEKKALEEIAERRKKILENYNFAIEKQKNTS